MFRAVTLTRSTSLLCIWRNGPNPKSGTVSVGIEKPIDGRDLDTHVPSQKCHIGHLEGAVLEVPLLEGIRAYLDHHEIRLCGRQELLQHAERVLLLQQVSLVDRSDHDG